MAVLQTIELSILIIFIINLDNFNKEISMLTENGTEDIEIDDFNTLERVAAAIEKTTGKSVKVAVSKEKRKGLRNPKAKISSRPSLVKKGLSAGMVPSSLALKILPFKLVVSWAKSCSWASPVLI